MFEFVKSMGLLRLGIFYIVMLMLICSLGDEQKKERLWPNSDVFVCQVDKGSVVMENLILT